MPQQLIVGIRRGRPGHQSQYHGELHKIGQDSRYLGESVTMQLAEDQTNQRGMGFRELRLGRGERICCDSQSVGNEQPDRGSIVGRQ